MNLRAYRVGMRAATGGAAVLMCATLAACGAQEGEAMVGFGVPRQQSVDEVTAERSPVSGTVLVADNGCLNLAIDEVGLRWIVWPPGAAQHPEDASATVVDGVTYRDGDPIAGVGALVSLTDLPDGASPDSYFASFGTYCGADVAGVVVLDWLKPAER